MSGLGLLTKALLSFQLGASEGFWQCSLWPNRPSVNYGSSGFDLVEVCCARSSAPGA